MKTISLTEKELQLLREQYTDEHAKAVEYVNQIKDILKKLGVTIKPAKDVLLEKEIKIGKKRGRKPKAKVDVKEPKKRGRKPKKVETAPVTAAKPIIKKSKKRGRPKRKVVPTTQVKPVNKVVKKKIESVPTAKPKSTPVKKTQKVVKKLTPKVVVKPAPEQKPVLVKKAAPKKKKIAKKSFGRKGVVLANLVKALPKKPLIVTGAPAVPTPEPKSE